MESAENRPPALERSESESQTSSADMKLENGPANKLSPTQVTDCNPALRTRYDATLNIEPFPEEILGKINVGEIYRAAEKDGELVVPITGLYRSVWDGAPLYIEENSDVWAGSEFGTTAWLASKPLGTYSTSIHGSLVQDLQCQDEIYSTIEALKNVTGNEYPEAKSRTIGRVFRGNRHPVPSIPAEHRQVLKETEWEILWQEVHRPIVVVGDNPRHVNFWIAVCGEGKSFVSMVQVGDKSFASPWGTQEFRGLGNALVLSRAEPDEGDLDFLEMQEALEDYIVYHSLFEQAVSACRLACRLPWLVKNKFVDALPKPIHSVDLLRGLHTSSGSLPTVDITFSLPAQFSIGTLLVAGHLLETRFNHWMWKNIDVDIALTSLAAAFRKVFYLWEINSSGNTSAWCGTDMDEVGKIGAFLGRHTYTRGADKKFRRPGLNTSFWEAAILGAVPGTSAHAVLLAQKPDAQVVGGTVVSVGAHWFAKSRAADIFGKRLFCRPYNDFPFPSRSVDAIHLIETEQRVAFAGKSLPIFELSQLQFGRVSMSSSFRALISVFPNFPSGGGMPLGGQFQEKYFQASTEKSAEIEPEETRPNSDDRVPRAFVSDGWHPIEPPQPGEIVDVTPGNESGYRAFAEALRDIGRPVELTSIVEAAKNRGRDGQSWMDMSILGYFGKQFDMDIILEFNQQECYRFPGSEGAPRVRLLCMGQNHVAWVREPTGFTEKKGVRFQIEGID